MFSRSTPATTRAHPVSPGSSDSSNPLARAAHDTGTIARHLAGPDHELRRAALRAVRELPDEAVTPVLDGAPTGLRRALYRTLFHTRRDGLADSLLSRVRVEYGDAEAAALLPACSPGQVGRHLPGLLHAVRSWRRLARRHPDILLGHLRELGAREGAPYARLPDRWRVLQALDPVRPAETGALLEELDPNGRRLVRLLPHAQRRLYGGGDRHDLDDVVDAVCDPNRNGDRAIRVLGVLVRAGGAPTGSARHCPGS